MKKLNALLIASLTALTITGGALLGDSVYASGDHNPKVKAEQTQQSQVEKKYKPEAGQTKRKRPMKKWEEKYYELHPEAKDQEKGDVEEKHNDRDEEYQNWHRL